MALQPCRATLLRGRGCARALTPCLRTYATDTTPSADQDALAGARHDNYTTELRVPKPSAGSANGKAKSPRWRQTPEAMQAELRMDWAKNPQNKVWTVNSNPKRLDEMYERLLGPGGSKMLPEELKWLAVTHKSFDQGRRGFNDRLALMGRLTLIMEATKHIVSKGPLPGARQPDEFERAPFENEQLLAVDNLNVETAKDIISKEALHQLAMNVGMLNVLRWKPRLASGVEVVMNGAIMAIIGAITLQHGSQVASEVVRERILARVQKTKQ